MRLDTFLHTLMRYRVTFAAVSATVLVAAVAGILLMPTQFVSTTQLLVSVSGTTTATAYENDNVVAGRINSYLALLTSEVVSQRVVDTLRLPISASDLTAKISATNVPPRTAIIDVAVTDSSAEGARRLAQTVADEFIAYAAAIETPTGEDDQKVRTIVVSEASEAQHRGTVPLVLIVLGACAALVLGAMVVWVRAWRDPVVRTGDRAAESTGLPLIGQIGAESTTATAVLDDYRRWRIRLRSIMTDTTQAEAAGRVLLLTSPDTDVDVLQVTTFLGGVFESAGDRAVVVDVVDVVDVDRAVAAHDQPHPGCQGDPLDRESVAASETFTATRLHIHHWVADPGGAGTSTAAKLIAGLRGDHAWVIISVSSTLSTVSVAGMSEHADGVVLVAGADSTRRAGLHQASQDLRDTGAPLIGVVLIGTPATAPDTKTPEICQSDSPAMQDTEQ